MARTTKVTPGAAETASKNDGEFKPLEAGKYNVSIFDHSIRQYGVKSNNAGRDFIALHLRISDGQKGANRRLFTNVGDFERWNPKTPGEEGSLNFTYYEFYKALGVEFKDADGNDLEEVDLPDYEELNGEEFTVRVAVVADTYAYDQAVQNGTVGTRTKADFLKNEVKNFFPLEDLPEESDAPAAGDDDEDSFDFS